MGNKSSQQTKASAHASLPSAAQLDADSNPAVVTKPDSAGGVTTPVKTTVKPSKAANAAGKGKKGRKGRKAAGTKGKRTKTSTKTGRGRGKGKGKGKGKSSKLSKANKIRVSSVLRQLRSHINSLVRLQRRKQMAPAHRHRSSRRTRAAATAASEEALPVSSPAVATFVSPVPAAGTSLPAAAPGPEEEIHFYVSDSDADMVDDEEYDEEIEYEEEEVEEEEEYEVEEEMLAEKKGTPV